jgi:predicted nucleotidyltransferase
MVTFADIQNLADDIARLFQPEQIILFGSYAHGQPREESDVDLLVIMEHEGRGRELRSQINRAVGYRFTTDLVVRRPADVQRRYGEHDPLIRDAIDNGKVLYERERVGMARQG